MNLSSFFTEVGVNVMCGAVLGVSLIQDDSSHKGVYRAPYRPISPIPLSSMLPQMHMYSIMSLGLAAATAGVRVFGIDRLNYFRATAAGHSRVAYFIGRQPCSRLSRPLLHTRVYSPFPRHRAPGGGLLHILFHVPFGVLGDLRSLAANIHALFPTQRPSSRVRFRYPHCNHERICGRAASDQTMLIWLPCFPGTPRAVLPAGQALVREHADRVGATTRAGKWVLGLLFCSLLVSSSLWVSLVLMILLDRNKQR